MRHVSATILVLLFALGFAVAQESKADLFGGYSYLNIDTNGLTSRQSANGWEASISGNFNKWFAAEAAVSGYYKTYDILGVRVAVSDYSYVAGPRVNFKPLFVHAMIGGDHLSAGALGASASQDGLAGAFGGGVQWRLTGQISFRTSADYVFSRRNILGGSSVTQNNFRASVGIVYSFGKRASAYTAPRTAVPSGMRIPALGLMATVANGRGAAITEVAPNGVAALAGLNSGDVISSVDGKAVRNPMELQAELATKAAGARVRLGYLIRGTWQSETVVLLGSQ